MISIIHTVILKNLIYQTVLVNYEIPLPIFSRGVNINPKRLFCGLRLALGNFLFVLTDLILERLDHLINIFTVLGEKTKIAKIH